MNLGQAISHLIEKNPTADVPEHAKKYAKAWNAARYALASRIFTGFIADCASEAARSDEFGSPSEKFALESAEASLTAAEQFLVAQFTRPEDLPEPKKGDTTVEEFENVIIYTEQS